MSAGSGGSISWRVLAGGSPGGTGRRCGSTGVAGVAQPVRGCRYGVGSARRGGGPRAGRAAAVPRFPGGGGAPTRLCQASGGHRDGGGSRARGRPRARCPCRGRCRRRWQQPESCGLGPGAGVRGSVRRARLAGRSLRPAPAGPARAFPAFARLRSFLPRPRRGRGGRSCRPEGAGFGPRLVPFLRPPPSAGDVHRDCSEVQMDFWF